MPRHKTSRSRTPVLVLSYLIRDMSFSFWPLRQELRFVQRENGAIISMWHSQPAILPVQSIALVGCIVWEALGSCPLKIFLRSSQSPKAILTIPHLALLGNPRPRDFPSQALSPAASTFLVTDAAAAHLAALPPACFRSWSSFSGSSGISIVLNLGQASSLSPLISQGDVCTDKLLSRSLW